MRIVCGDEEDPSLVIVLGLRFREGKRPKVRFSVRRGHEKTVELGDQEIGALETEGEAEEEKESDVKRGRKRHRDKQKREE